MRTNADALGIMVGPVSQRAERNDLERIITDLSDDRQPRPERRQQVRSRTKAALRDQPLDGISPRRFGVERIITGNDLAPVYYLERGLIAARPVGRIEVRGPSGRVIAYGTGFLVAPGVLVTNAHVLTTAAEVALSDVQFQFQLDINGNDVTPVTFNLTTTGAEPIINTELDVAIVAVEPRSVDGRDLHEFG